MASETSPVVATSSFIPDRSDDTHNDGSQSGEEVEKKGFPIVPLAVLALVRIAEPIALTSIFPYVWTMVKRMLRDQDSNSDDDNAAFKAGLLIAAFSLAEAATGMLWGSVSDRIGRKPVLLIGCGGTIVSLLLVGSATSFWVALAGRLMGGLLNGNSGVIQSMVTELVTEKEHSARAFSMIPFIWTIGTIIGPSIGGYFADPSGRLIDPDTTNPALKPMIAHPYLLPNVVCAGLLALSILAGAFCLPETNPASKRKRNNNDMHSSVTAANDPTDCNLEIGSSKSEPKSTIPRAVVPVITGLGIFALHAMCFDVLLPMFLQDAITRSSRLSGGLGWTTERVGLIMGATGFLDFFIQLGVFPWMVGKLGNWKTFKIVTWIHPIPFLLMPLLVMLLPSVPKSGNTSQPGMLSLPFPHSLISPSSVAGSVAGSGPGSAPFTWPVMLAFAVIIVIRASSSLIAYPVLLMMINDAVDGTLGREPDSDVDSRSDRTSPDECSPLLRPTTTEEVSDSSANLGAINGLSASVAAASRMLASPVAGLLFGIGTKVDVSALPWWGGALISLIGIWNLKNFQTARSANGTRNPM